MGLLTSAVFFSSILDRLRLERKRLPEREPRRERLTWLYERCPFKRRASDWDLCKSITWSYNWIRLTIWVFSVMLQGTTLLACIAMWCSILVNFQWFKRQCIHWQTRVSKISRIFSKLPRPRTRWKRLIYRIRYGNKTCCLYNSIRSYYWWWWCARPRKCIIVGHSSNKQHREGNWWTNSKTLVSTNYSEFQIHYRLHITHNQSGYINGHVTETTPFNFQRF